MKSNKLLFEMLVGTLLLGVSWAQQSGAAISGAPMSGAAVYKSKCASCHGATGQGSKAGPVLMGTSLGKQQVSDLLTQGEAGKKPPHSKAIQGLTQDQAKAATDFVKSLR